MRRLFALFLLAAIGVADDNRSLPDRTRQYLVDLVKIDTSNPPGNETAVANYLKQVADSHAISCETMGNDTKRLNFVARLKGSGHGKPLLLMAHSDVVPVGPLAMDRRSVQRRNPQRIHLWTRHAGR